MDEDNKICENCNREIPAGNYTIHLLHCVRNIRVCPVCKEPVPLTELEEHTDKLHKLMPCKQCGEMVRGTDMEDHIRDSCDHTIQSCRWCELELSRRELPLHEGYCGARTEECPQCGEFVMHKYRQLHLDSNHGFVRLDDDPVPRPQRLRTVASTSMSIIGPGAVYHRPANRLPRLLDLPDQSTTNPVLARLINAITEANATEYSSMSRVIHNQNPRSPDAASDQGPNYHGRHFNRWQVIGLNTPRNVPGTSNDAKPAPRGAIKKRKAPKPPNVSTPQSQPEQSQAAPVGRTYSLFPSTSNSTPNTPISSPMTGPIAGPIRGPKSGPVPGPNNRSNLQLSANDNAPGGANGRRTRKVSNEDQKRKENKSVPVNSPAKQSGMERNREEMTNAEDFRNVKPMTTEEFMKRFRQLQLDNTERESSRPERFSRKEKSSRPDRFSRKEEENSPASGDRFSAIKSSLKELRRGLNEVTAPYNNSNNANERGNASRDNDAPTRKSSKSNSDNDGSEGTLDNSPREDESGGGDNIDWGEDDAWRDVAEGDDSGWVGGAAGDSSWGGAGDSDWGGAGDSSWGGAGDSSWGGEVAGVDVSGWGVATAGGEAGGDEAAGGQAGACGVDVIDVKLPCEFCGTLIQANDLVQHQTGCRPDLAQLLPVADDEQEDQQVPVIPCEYCEHRMPLELIGEHQERCSRKMKRMFMK